MCASATDEGAAGSASIHCPFRRARTRASTQAAMSWSVMDLSPRPRAPLSGAEAGERRLDHRLGRDPEMLEDGFVGPAFAEGLHADERSVANDRVPSEAHRRLDPDPDLGRADHRAAVIVRLLEERLETGHRHDPGGDSLVLQLRLRGDGERNFGARGEDRYLG